MPKSKSIGKVFWTKEELQKAAFEFLNIYKNRPIKENKGGMKSPHLFPTWFLLRRLQPKVVVESGVWKGQGTWFIEKAVPKAKIYCIDPNLTHLVYRSKKAVYSTVDFSKQDWSALPKEDTLVFFDDHQDAIKRIKIARAAGFRHLMFEDNYPPGRGDAYSVKKALMFAGHRPQIYYSRMKIFNFLVALKVYLTQFLKGYFISPNREDAAYLENVVEVYYEFPPVIKPRKTRWGDPWTQQQYPTPEPLFANSDRGGMEIYVNEGMAYNWICYIRLK